MLHLAVADDGRGVDVERVRSGIVERGLTDAATAARLSEEEILTFLFLPGFSTAGRVTDVSGRGVGLDVVQDALKALGGRVSMANVPGRGLTFTFALPLTLSVLPVLLVEVAREPYALPLTKVERVSILRGDEIKLVEGRAFAGLRLDGRAEAGGRGEAAGRANVGLVSARQVLGLGEEPPPTGEVAVVVVRGGANVYGLAVDRLIGEEVIVVRPLDPRHAALPIVIDSYKDRDEDRLRGLAAGASYYLPKSSFQDDRFLRAVEELIGGPEGA
jgi:two-component system sensor histidine kinase and response regulator WspE